MFLYFNLRNKVLLKEEKKMSSKVLLHSDEDIINEVKNGNKECYEEIVRKYNQRLYRIAVSYGVKDDDAEEVVQLAYIAAYEKLNQFRGEARFSTWLIKILINECLMIKRKQKRFEQFNESDYENVTLMTDNHQNPEVKYMEKEKREIIEKAVKELPEKYRSVFILKEVEGMSIEEIADALNISKVNVKVRLHRARTMLKDNIKGRSDISVLFTFGNERCDNVTAGVMDYIRNLE
jgi:RNA polymerase sigma-70 factor (ECF subfamily)